MQKILYLVGRQDREHISVQISHTHQTHHRAMLLYLLHITYYCSFFVLLLGVSISSTSDSVLPQFSVHLYAVFLTENNQVLVFIHES